MVKNWLAALRRASANNRLLLRYYFAIIFGIAAVALVLDLVFYPWVKTQESQRTYDALYQLANTVAEAHINEPINNNDGNDQNKTANKTTPPQEHILGRYTLRILPAQTVHSEQAANDIQPYSVASNDQGQRFLNWPSRNGQHWVQFGPLEPAALPPDWPTWIFYGSLFILVSLWLQPLLKDLDRISHAVNDFRNDYRAPLPQLKNSSNLKPLANNIASMAEKIRHLIETQKDLSNVLSHEMRTPLSRVKFSLALLSSNEQLSQQQRNELAGIDQDINELQQLTQAMLEFAKLDHPDMAIEVQTLEANYWLHSYADKQQRHCQPLQLTTELTAAANSTSILADPYWLELALSNLVANAQRYAQNQIEITLNHSAEGFELSVADDGPGIAEAQQNQVVKPFYQADHNNKKGFGLGLALVDRIAQLHGGHLRVGSAALGGALVSIKVSYSA
ncbi:sensor histidine kinase [Halioxenophilus aromaticivorans]|uniref:histidine kinase n=1 Tax=Halioxenophilus aromaticivorans TaxID=1306992 RepID=A0AAV3U0R0_9ALTE